ncbi:MAG: NAD-dependent protein deacylase [Chitinophagales bacterium]|nr:MAG: NAD-dependent protein deacylase [Chitinophagales bacterium]
MKKVVVLTGAGISAESGLSTFRDAGGLWEGYDINEVATPEGWAKNPQRVLEFYNQRRRQLLKAQPNAAHYALAEMEKHFDVHIITQNVDDLHERAGSTKVLHLHGELLKVRSSVYPQLVYEWKKDLKMGDTCELGTQLRPHVVWFGEEVLLLPQAAKIASAADIFLVVGTSLVVYPAAGLIHYTGYDIPKYIIDPKAPQVHHVPNVTYIPAQATVGVPQLFKQLLNEQS